MKTDTYMKFITGFKKLTKKQLEVFESIALNKIEYHEQRTLNALIERDLIFMFIEKIPNDDDPVSGHKVAKISYLVPDFVFRFWKEYLYKPL